jgi:hypothetical protein
MVVGRTYICVKLKYKLLQTFLFVNLLISFNSGKKKCLKILQWLSETVNRVRTDNALAKRKKNKKTSNVQKNITRRTTN